MGRIVDYIIKYSQQVDFGDAVLFEALDIAQEIEEAHQFLMSGKSSSGLAASTIYIASFMVDQQLTQNNLAWAICDSGVCRVSRRTIQKVHKAIVQELGLYRSDET